MAWEKVESKVGSEEGRGRHGTDGPEALRCNRRLALQPWFPIAIGSSTQI